jgi:hypothetical protein
VEGAEGHELLLPFDVDDPQFVRGFELGRLWQRLRTEDGDVAETVHATNLEMLLRLGEATGRPVQTEDLGETWVLATFAAVADVVS